MPEGDSRPESFPWTSRRKNRYGPIIRLSDIDNPVLEGTDLKEGNKWLQRRP